VFNTTPLECTQFWIRVNKVVTGMFVAIPANTSIDTYVSKLMNVIQAYVQYQILYTPYPIIDITAGLTPQIRSITLSSDVTNSDGNSLRPVAPPGTVSSSTTVGMALVGLGEFPVRRTQKTVRAPVPLPLSVAPLEHPVMDVATVIKHLGQTTAVDRSRNNVVILWPANTKSVTKWEEITPYIIQVAKTTVRELHQSSDLIPVGKEGAVYRALSTNTTLIKHDPTDPDIIRVSFASLGLYYYVNASDPIRKCSDDWVLELR
jgi:hypothetical protein